MGQAGIEPTKKEREQMFKVYQERQSINHVAEETNSAWRTVNKYRKIDRWDDRLQEIGIEVRRIQDIDIIQDRSTLFNQVDTIYQKLIERIEDKIESDPEYTPTVKDLDTLVRLRCALIGVPLSDSPKVAVNINNNSATINSEFWGNVPIEDKEKVNKILKDVLKKQIKNENGDNTEKEINI